MSGFLISCRLKYAKTVLDRTYNLLIEAVLYWRDVRPRSVVRPASLAVPILIRSRKDIVKRRLS